MAQAPIVDPGLAHLDRADPRYQLPLRQMPVADHQPPTRVVSQLCVLLDIGSYLLIDCTGQHSLSPHSKHVLQSRSDLVARLRYTDLICTFFHGAYPFSRLTPGF